MPSRRRSDGLGQLVGILAEDQRPSAEPGLQLLASDGGRVGLGRVDVDGEGHLLGRLAVDQPDQVDAGLVRIGVAEAIGVLVGLADAHDLTGGPDDFDLGLAGLIVHLCRLPSGSVTGAPASPMVRSVSAPAR